MWIKCQWKIHSAALQVREFLKKTIDEMLERAKEKVNADCPQQPKLPLIRLRVIYTNEDYIFNSIRFGQQYGDKVSEQFRFFRRSFFDAKPEFGHRLPIQRICWNSVWSRSGWNANGSKSMKMPWTKHSYTRWAQCLLNKIGAKSNWSNFFEGHRWRRHPSRRLRQSVFRWSRQ